jgi:phage major head subunit gpT-like protein
MATAGNLPKHLEVAARSAVLGAKARDDMPYRLVASEFDLTSASTTLVDLGGMPQPSRNARVVETLVEKSKTVVPQDFYLTLSLTQNAIDDDQTGTIERQFGNVLPAFQRDINSKVFTYLNAGDTTTYGLSVDGLALFSSSHVYPSAAYQTAQDNLNALAISIDNFTTTWVTARQFRDDQGNFLNLDYKLLVTNPTNIREAANITGNQSAYDTANREDNPFAKMGMSYLTVPEFDTTAWVLVADAPEKPMFVAIRKRPALNDMWFDAQTGDGGTWYWQYHGRYVVDYGDPLLCIMGNT